MVLKKLPLEVQSIFCASTQIKTFKTAVEELVYNSFDADSTSIAIRVNIQENYIQLVDNGHGVSKYDFKLIGQRYTTSKYDESSTCKSKQNYGHSGQALANIIQISQSVKITSRCKNTEETWLKHFYNGKEKECVVTSARPSIGTTVEIKGFLYNLTIQKKAVNALQELQNIKTFLEQMSLIHCNTSMTLRDNSENEIIFKIHKNRDIYQTFSSLFGMEKSNLQELQVEKKQHKVTGFIQKQDTESHGFQWIYVNKRFIDNSNLHKIVNESLAKKTSLKRNIKAKNRNNEEDKITPNNKQLDYFIFVKCPHDDYDTLSNPKHMLEFKTSSEIKKLLDKLIQFYYGDINLDKKTITKPVEDKKCKNNETNTRNQVKIILDKILGTQNKMNNGSHLHNGVKGKMIKRKTKKYMENNSKPKSKLKPNNRIESVIPQETYKPSSLMESHDEKLLDNDNYSSFKIPKNKQTRNKKAANTKKQQVIPEEITPQKTKFDAVAKDPVISKFEKETDEVQRRCHILAKKVDNLLGFKKKRKRKMFTNEYVQYSTVIKDSKKVSIRKRINEVIIHEYLPLPRKVKITDHDHNVLKSYDLLHPVTSPLQQNIVQSKDLCAHPKKQQTDVYNLLDNSPYDLNIPRLTYESHCYSKDTEVCHNEDKLLERNKHCKFMSHVSQDNFISPKKRRKESVNEHVQTTPKNHTITRKPNLKKRGHCEYQDESQLSYSIHFTETGSQLHKTLNLTPNVSDDVPFNDEIHNGSTYTIIDTDRPLINDLNPKSNIHNSLDVHDFRGTYCVKALHDSNYNTYHEQSPNYNDTHIISETPNKCETYCVEHESNHYHHQAPDYNDSLIRKGTLDNCETYCADASQDSSYYMGHDKSPKYNDSLIRNETPDIVTTKNLDIIFISNSQQSNNGAIVDKDIDPLNICETVFDNHDEHENGEYSFIFNSMNDVFDLNDSAKTIDLCETELPRSKTMYHDKVNISRDNAQNVNKQKNHDGHEFELNNFTLKNRRRYLPKGMSQIFVNCNTKSICNYEFDKDYFKESVYNNFAEEVQINSEIFEAKIQNVNELATKDIERVNNKLSRDNACITFNGESLKQLKVLGQVDYKFIATKIKGKSNQGRDFLVLFDQHAVDERIRLEKNMAEYFDADQWKTVSLDGISLKLTRDEIIYLHNFKTKFRKLGLEWTILENSEVLMTAIPEAILGKNPRQADTVLKAVKSLLKEEINMIKEQGGCLSLYPKSIMDLVSSEACRYAIMFGDPLSRTDCKGLLTALSECKTPFQCAHGRPVMAVLMDIKTEKHEYKINFKRVQQFKRRMQNLKNK